jgi:hypothetical protein
MFIQVPQGTASLGCLGQGGHAKTRQNSFNFHVRYTMDILTFEGGFVAEHVKMPNIHQL